MMAAWTGTGANCEDAAIRNMLSSSMLAFLAEDGIFLKPYGTSNSSDSKQGEVIMSYINETSAPEFTGTESKWCRKMLTDGAARSTISVPEEFASDCKLRRIDRQPRTTPGTYTHKNDCKHCSDFIIISCIGSRTLTWTFFLGWETCTIDRVLDVWLRRVAYCFFGDQRNLREYFLHPNSVRTQLSVIILQYGTNRMTLNFERPPCDSLSLIHI